MKKSLLLLFLFPGCVGLAQQTSSITLEQCRRWATDYSPLTQKKELINQALKSSQQSLSTGYYPQAEVNAQATYQSDVTQIPISIPGVAALSRDQYKATLDVSQVLYDAGLINRQKTVKEAGSAVERQSAEVSLQTLRESISSVYLNALLITQSIEVANTVDTDLNNNIRKMEAMFANGTATQIDIKQLEAEQLKNRQQIIDLNAALATNIATLAELTGKALPTNVKLETPDVNLSNSNVSQRPELQLYDFQKQNFEAQSKLSKSYNLPKVSAFASGGYGKPTYNMLSDKFDWMYIVGLRLNVPLTTWSSGSKDRKTYSIQQSIVETDKANFEQNNRVQLLKQKNEAEKFQDIIVLDEKIVDKRTIVKTAMAVRLTEGTATTIDYIQELNAEKQARLNQKMHEIQRLLAIIQYNDLLGVGY